MPTNQNKPHFQHDCTTCRFLGRGHAPILADRRSDKTQIFDFYICEGGTWRSFIARFGNSPEAYMSNALLTCAELTPLDLVALCNGLELLPEENERLLRCLADMYRGKLNVHDYEKLFISPECPFGNGNFLFPPI